MEEISGVILTLYSVLFFLLSPFLFLVFVWRYGLRRTLRGLPERFGWGGAWPGLDGFWVHAASVGEVKAVENLLRAVKERFPRTPLMLTTTTVNGKELAQRLGVADAVRLAPLDRPGAVGRLIHRSRPLALVLVETELWPHWMATLSRRNVPVIVANGRISDKAFPWYKRCRPLVSPLLRQVARVGAQSPVHASRFLTLGAPPRAVSVAGNLKFDVPLPDLQRRSALRSTYGFGPEDLVFMMGSTHPGEEAAGVRVFSELRLHWPRLRGVVAPRHADRAGDVRRVFADAGFSTVLRTEISSRGPSADVMIVDTVGELADVYGVATLAFVGGSLVPRGGQNPLEPARWGIPILFGPRMENFSEMAALFVERQAAIQVPDEAVWAAKVRSLLESPDLRDRYGRAARALADSQRGALEAHMALLDGIVPSGIKGP